MSCSTRARSLHGVWPLTVSAATLAGFDTTKEALPPPPALRLAEVRPPFHGIPQKRLFVEGSRVKADQQLYQIDPAPFQPRLDSAAAGVETAPVDLRKGRIDAAAGALRS